MKKKYLLAGSLLFFQLAAKAQAPATSTQEKIKKTVIDLVYNHYMQEGYNSAVTGGLGTEELTVYGPMVTIKTDAGKSALSFNFGADIISSASTDKIDFVVSSASILDARSYVNATAERKFGKHDLSVYAGTGFSVESDYFSIGSKIGLDKNDPKHLRTYTAEFQMFNDDLRWGRLNPGYFEPVKLIYPSELRYKNWYDTHKRNSFNLKLGFTQTLNKRTNIGVFPEFAYQHGLLSTPFHRIYFSNGTKVVEKLPDSRVKGALALRFNRFVGGKVVLKNTLYGYTDDFGIKAFSLEHETAFKLKPQLTLLPNARFYTQQASRYFAEFGMHLPHEPFYTSDFDLSGFRTYDLGIGIRYSPFANVSKRMQIKTLLFRYNYMHRSNNLSAHIFSISFRSESYKRKPADRNDKSL